MSPPSLPKVVALLLSVPIVLVWAVVAFGGVYVGITSDAPYFSQNFKIGILVSSIASMLCVLAGVRYQATVVGKLLILAGLAVWFFVGLFGFGPQ